MHLSISHANYFALFIDRRAWFILCTLLVYSSLLHGHAELPRFKARVAAA